MAKEKKTSNLDELTEILGATPETPHFHTSMYSPEKMTLKNLYMMQAFGVMFTKLLNDNGNASILMRKQQLSVTEIHNIIHLCNIVGECFDTIHEVPTSIE